MGGHEEANAFPVSDRCRDCIEKENRGTSMGFAALMTDTVSVLKQNGQTFEGIKASVQTDKVFIQGNEPLIEIGDLIRRKMSNGGEETFRVLDPGFHEKFHSIPAGYQMRVVKLGVPEAAQAVQSITYNISGHNARINQNSVDNSTNVVTVNPDAVELLSALRNELARMDLSPDQRKDASDLLDTAEAQIQGGKPSKPVLSAVLKALPNAANIAAIVSALLSMF